MAAVAIISIVFSFIFVSKIFTPPIEISSNLISVNKEAERTNQDEGKITQEGKTETPVVEEASSGNEVANEVNNEENTTGGTLSNTIVPLESIVVNLGGAGSRRYLRILISLELKSEGGKKKIKENMVVLRDKLITFLSAKSAKEIETEGGLFKLRLEIKNVLNEILRSEIVNQVYFSDFIVQ